MNKLPPRFVSAMFLLVALLLPLAVFAQEPLAWEEFYDGNTIDAPKALYIDGNGRAVVSGSSYGTGKVGFSTLTYSAGGEQQWLAIYREQSGASLDLAASMAVDDEGNVYVAGGACDRFVGGVCKYSNFLTIKYDPDGEELWRATYSGPIRVGGFASDIAIDNNGHVAVTGTICAGINLQGECINVDSATVLYTDEGVELWDARYQGFGVSNEEGHQIVFDRDGNIFVAGLVWEVLNQTDIVLLKYDLDGDLIIDLVWDSPERGEETITDMLTDDLGNTYIAGATCVDTGVAGNCNDFDFVTLCYDMDYFLVWDQITPGSADYHDIARAMALDSDGSLYVVGEMFEKITESYNYGIVKFSDNGDVLWKKEFDGPASKDDFAVDVVTDGQSLVLVGGSACTKAGIGGACVNNDIYVIAYNRAGSKQYEVVYDGPAGNDDSLAAMALAPSGALVLAGSVCAETDRAGCANYDFAVVKYQGDAPVDDDTADDDDDDDDNDSDDDDSDDDHDDDDDDDDAVGDDDDDEGDDDNGSYLPEDDDETSSGSYTETGGHACGC